jgi:WS/DGAT/MGAT family acyltransferase
MPSYRYDPLSPQDAAFLWAESALTPMHISVAFIADAGPLRNAAGGIDVARIRAFIYSRLHRIPRYRQRIVFTTLRQRPVWVDDDQFSIDYHVRHTALPRPGTAEQLKDLIGRLGSHLLDRAHPLWELWVVEGLEDGKRFALISKVHHSMTDGVSGAELMTVLMSLSPSEQPGPLVPYIPRPMPSQLELRRDDLLDLVGGPMQLVRTARWLLDTGRRSQVGQALRGVADLVASGIVPASETPLNQTIGPHRRFDYFSQELAAVKAVKEKLGGTLNDVVLATVAGGMRHFLKRRRVNVSRLEFRVATPVSVRSAVDREALGNRVSAWIIRLPLAQADPVKRLAAIRARTRRLKESNQALGADLLSSVTEWTGTTLLSIGTRLQNIGRTHNLVVTNVPGPQVPLYLLGAPLHEAYPIGPLFQHQAVIIALFSYAGRLFWGLNADAMLVPDLADLRHDLEASFQELVEAAGSPAAQQQEPDPAIP